MHATVADLGGTGDEVDRRAANRALAVSAAGLAATGVVELVFAVVTGSVALLGDALHNLSDVSTSVVVFAGFWISRRPPSARYPYGYQRAEDLAGLGVALVIWVSAAFAGWESYHKLVDQTPTTHLALGMAGAVLGVVGNQLVARYKLRVGRRIRSATLVADAKHSWLDALSSLGALAGLILVAAGHPWGDAIAGFTVTAFICHVGLEVTRDLLHHLMDGIDPNDLAAAQTAAIAVDGVRAAQVRGRWTGRAFTLEIETHLDQELSLTAADDLAHAVEHAVHQAVPAATHVHAHAHSAREE